MRYTVGEKTAFIGIDFKPNSPRFGRLYHPWEDELLEVKILLLTCEQHHRVPGQWDNEIKYDGFIFKDEEGRQWNNQYPQAVYGQISTDRDQMVSLADSDREVEIYEMTQLSTFLENVYRGIKKLPSVESKALQEFADTLIKKVKDELKMDVIVENTKLGDKIFKDRFDVSLVDFKETIKSLETTKDCPVDPMQVNLHDIGQELSHPDEGSCYDPDEHRPDPLRYM